jgi:hypothetical protein
MPFIKNLSNLELLGKTNRTRLIGYGFSLKEIIDSNFNSEGKFFNQHGDWDKVPRREGI